MSVEILDLAALALTAVFFALLYYLHRKKHVDFGVRTILAVGLGLIVGLVFKGHHTYVAAVGTIYAHVVSAVVIPLLIFSIISSITNLGNSVRLKKTVLRPMFFRRTELPRLVMLEMMLKISSGMTTAETTWA